MRNTTAKMPRRPYRPPYGVPHKSDRFVKHVEPMALPSTAEKMLMQRAYFSNAWVGRKAARAKGDASQAAYHEREMRFWIQLYRDTRDGREREPWFGGAVNPASWYAMPKTNPTS